jgi:uncharacterized repeat protein (TIGR01451 family)
LEATITGPDAAVVGETAPFEIRVSNNGSQPATGLVITNRFDPGLEHAQAASPIERDLPDLAPGATRRIAVQFRVTRPGTLCQTVEIAGAGEVRGSARHCLIATAQAGTGTPAPAGDGNANPAPGPINPQPSLSVVVHAPERRRVGQVAEFRIEATNTGNVALTNVKMTANFELSLEPAAATDGWKQSGGALFWTIDSLPPGRTMLREINFNCLQVSTKACVRASVESTEGISKAEEDCVEVLPAENAGTSEPPAASDQPGRLSLSVADQVDPVRVGGTTTYQVTLTNGAAEPDRNVVLVVAVPTELTLKKYAGPVQGRITDRKMIFDPIAELRKGETVTFSLEFTAQQAGTARLHTEVTSARQTQPIAADETTEVVAEE